MLQGVRPTVVVLHLDRERDVPRGEKAGDKMVITLLTQIESLSISHPFTSGPAAGASATLRPVTSDWWTEMGLGPSDSYLSTKGILAAFSIHDWIKLLRKCSGSFDSQNIFFLHVQVTVLGEPE